MVGEESDEGDIIDVQVCKVVVLCFIYIIMVCVYIRCEIYIYSLVFNQLLLLLHSSNFFI